LLLQEARAAVAVARGAGPSPADAVPHAAGATVDTTKATTRCATVLALVWYDDPGFYARFIQAGEARPSVRPLGLLSGPIRFGERSHPIYVRGEGILGAVYPTDLLNVAAADRAEFYLAAEASAAARATAGGTLRVLPLGRGGCRRPEVPALILRELRDALMTRREVSVRLPAVDEGITTPLRIAYLERTDRAGAFEAEYGPARGVATAGRATDASPP